MYYIIQRQLNRTTPNKTKATKQKHIQTKHNNITQKHDKRQ